jgi:hypothetical protein
MVHSVQLSHRRYENNRKPQQNSGGLADLPVTAPPET